MIVWMGVGEIPKESECRLGQAKRRPNTPFWIGLLSLPPASARVDPTYTCSGRKRLLHKRLLLLIVLERLAGERVELLKADDRGRRAAPVALGHRIPDDLAAAEHQPGDRRRIGAVRSERTAAAKAA